MICCVIRSREKNTVADPQAQRAAFWDMIRQYRFAMFTTRDQGDVLRSRPMTTIQKDFDGQLCFFAPADSDVVKAVMRYAQVCLSYGNANESDFVCAAGPAEIDRNAEAKRRLWNSMVQAWFPQGPDADSVVLIRVRVDHAEYWDGRDNKLVQLISMLKAGASGKPPRNMGEHHTVPV
jgi:general stress protein 26